MEVGWTCPEDAGGQLTEDSTTMDTTRKEKEGKTKRDLEKDNGKGTETGKHDLEYSRKNCKRQRKVEGSCCGLMCHK